MVALWPNSALSNRRRMIVIQAPVESPIRAAYLDNSGNLQ
jgi:hypothetical protein